MSRFSRRSGRRMIVGIGCLSICILGIVIVVSVRDSQRQAIAIEARVNGLALYEEQRYEDAIPVLSFVVSRDRQDVEVLLAFADARSKVPTANNRHLAEAAHLYSTVLDLQPQNTVAMEQLMLLNERLNRRIEALDASRRILAREPEHVEALRVKATMHYLASRFVEAGETCERLMAIEPDEVSWRVLFLQVAQDRGATLDELVAICDGWIDDHQLDGRYHMLQAQLLAAAGRPQRARELSMQAAELGAASPQVLQHLVALLELLELPEQAANAITVARERFPEEQWPHEAVVRQLWQAGRINEALAEIDRIAAEHDRVGGGLLRWQSMLHILHNDAEAAAESLNRLKEAAQQQPQGSHHADLAWAEAAAARAQLSSMSWRDAIHRYQRALAMEPHDPTLHFLMGEAYAKVSEHNLAAASFERSLRADPNWMTAQTKYADTLMRLGRHDEVVRLTSKMIQRSTDPSLRLHLLLASAWTSSRLSAQDVGLVDADGEPVALIDYLNMLHGQFPNHARIIELLGIAQLGAGDRVAATELLESSLQAEAADESVVLTVLRMADRYELPLDASIMLQAITRFPTSPELIAIQAQRVHEGGDVDHAMALIKQISEADVQGARARAAYLTWADHPTATDALRKVLKLAEGDVKHLTFVLSQQVTWKNAQLAAMAIDQLRDAIGPRSPRALLARATYLLQFESTDPAAMSEALMLVSDALAQTPESLNALRLMATLYLASDPPDRRAAVRHLERAVRAHPHRTDLYPQLVRLLQQEGNFAAAEEYLARLSVSSADDEQSWETELMLLESQGALDRIVARLGHRVATHESVFDQVALAMSLHRTGDSEQAMDLLEPWLEQEAVDAAVVSTVATIHTDHGRADDALTLLTAYETSHESGISAILLGWFHKQTGSRKEATKWFRLALERSPERQEAWQHLAQHLLADGEYLEARKVAADGLKLDPEDIALLTVYTVSSIHLGGQARREALDALAAVDCHVEALVPTLRLYDRVAGADSPEAITELVLADLRRLVEEYPTFARAWRLAIAAHIHANRTDEAARLASMAMSRMPGRAEFAEQATQLQIVQGQLHRALDTAGRWRSWSLNNPLPADATIAAVQLQLGEFHSAANQVAAHADRIVRERHASPDRLIVLVRSFTASGRTSELAAKLEPLLDDDEATIALVLYAIEEISERKVEPILEVLEPHVARNGQLLMELAGRWAQLAARTYDDAHFDRAHQLAHRARQLHERFEVPAMLLDAWIAEERHNHASAARLYRDVIERRPDHWVALNNLAHLLVLEGAQLHEAVELSERALSMQPDNANLLNTHAQVLLAAGRAGEAYPFAKRALEQSPDDAGIMLTLSRIFLARSQFDEAGAMYDQAVQVLDQKDHVKRSTQTARQATEQALEAAHQPLSRLNETDHTATSR